MQPYALETIWIYVKHYQICICLQSVLSNAHIRLYFKIRSQDRTYEMLKPLLMIKSFNNGKLYEKI